MNYLKSSLILISFLLIGNYMMAQSQIKFEKTTHDFGTLKEEQGKATAKFVFVNVGKDDLKIVNVRTSCGCTASDYPHDPIKPGKTGKIQITFNSANRLGMQHKKVTIRANTSPEFTVLNVYAQVIDKNSEN